MFKNRSEICAAASVNLQIAKVSFPVFFTGDMCTVLNKTVTLDDVKVHVAEKIFMVTEDFVSFFHEAAYRFSRAGAGGINRDYKFFHTIHFLIFQMFNQRHVSVMIQSIDIRNIIKTRCVGVQFFSLNSETSEKTAEVIAVFMVQGKFFVKIAGSCSTSGISVQPETGGT